MIVRPTTSRSCRWLLLAYPDRVVKRRGVEGTGVMVGGRGVRLAPGSVVRDAELYLALDAREDDRGGRSRGAGLHGQPRPVRNGSRNFTPVSCGARI